MRELKGKTALVTGGSQGIGAAICLELAEYGCDVALTFVGDSAPADRICAAIAGLGCRAESFAADASCSAETARVFAAVIDRFGGLDILVCNAGIARDGVIWNMTDQAWDEVIAVNLKGTFNYIREAARIFKDQRGGRIVNVTSINGMRGKFGQANYTAAKGGIIALTKTAARELGKFNVTVNAVAPGMVDTEMAGALAPEFRDTAIKETLLGRLATPQDIAQVVVFLCSDGARHITGEVVKVDGGQYL